MEINDNQIKPASREGGFGGYVQAMRHYGGKQDGVVIAEGVGLGLERLRSFHQQTHPYPGTETLPGCKACAVTGR